MITDLTSMTLQALIKQEVFYINIEEKLIFIGVVELKFGPCEGIKGTFILL